MPTKSPIIKKRVRAIGAASPASKKRTTDLMWYVVGPFLLVANGIWVFYLMPTVIIISYRFNINYKLF